MSIHTILLSLLSLVLVPLVAWFLKKIYDRFCAIEHSIEIIKGHILKCEYCNVPVKELMG
jgi:cell division protein FtsB